MAIKAPNRKNLELKNLSNNTIEKLNKQIKKSEMYNVVKNPDDRTHRRITNFKNLV